METLRVRVFVDFWNFNLNLMSHARAAGHPGRSQLDWRRLGPWLSERALEALGCDTETARGATRFEGLHVYMSHNPCAAGDDGLRRFAHMLERFPGVTVIMKERRVKDAPTCPSCHGTVACCPDPSCHASMRGTMEKGIDTAIVTDMIGLAWEDAWDVAVLASADADFIPAVDALRAKGRAVVHAGIASQPSRLSRRCAGSIDVSRTLAELRRDEAA